MILPLKGKKKVSAAEFCHTDSSSKLFETSEDPASYKQYQRLFPSVRNKQTLVVCDKNPFRYQTSVTVNEVLIPEDNIGATLGGGVSPSSKTETSKVSGPIGTPVLEVLQHPAAPNSNRVSTVTPSTWKEIAEASAAVEAKYVAFYGGYVGSRALLMDDGRSCKERVEEARKLAHNALDLVTSSSMAQARGKLESAREQAVGEADKGADDTKLVRYYACVLNGQQAAIDNVRKGILDPTLVAWGDAGAFVFQHSFGPYALPTSADWSVSQTALKQDDLTLLPGRGPATGSFDMQACVDGTEAHETAGTGTSTDVAPEMEPVTPPATGSGSDSAPVLKQGSFLFGASRFIVTTGTSVALVRKQEFQVVNLGTSTVASNTVAYKTNDRTQFNYGMAFANVRLYRESFEDNAAWATFGITAKPDNQGTSPNYLLGVSQGFWGNRVLLTVGDAFIQQQRLVPGLVVGGAVPSGLVTKDGLPVTKNYRQGLSIGFSFRVLTAPGRRRGRR